MAYKDTSMAWQFTCPQAGETDSVERVRESLAEVDEALISPVAKSQLTMGGAPVEGASPDQYHEDAYLKQQGVTRYVTSLHYHPTPDGVPSADHAAEADHATSADSATSASKLVPGANVNGHLFDGTADITISNDDIPDATRVYWGTTDPSQHSFPGTLRAGDLYVRVS